MEPQCELATQEKELSGYMSLHYDDFVLTVNQNMMFEIKILHQTNKK